MMDCAPTLKIIGVGGSGCYAVSKMAQESGCEHIAAHTDASSLLKVNVPKKVLLGKDVTKGRSTGNDRSLGEAAAINAKDQIEEVLSGAEVTFIIASLGGGTGAGAAPIVAAEAKALGSFVISMVNIPFQAEGRVCRKNAERGIEALRPHSDLIIALPNDRFLSIFPDKSIGEAFNEVNHMFFEAVEGVARLVKGSGIDDLRAILTGFATLGRGGGETVETAVRQALASPLIYCDISQSIGVLMSFVAGKGSFGDVHDSLELVAERTNDTARIVWTKGEDPHLSGIEVVCLFTGVAHPMSGDINNPGQ